MLERVARASWGPWSDKLEGSHRRTFEDDNSALRHYAVALPPVTLTRNGHPSNEIVVNANAVGLHEPQTFAKGSWPRSARLHGSVQREYERLRPCSLGYSFDIKTVASGSDL